jgi:signal transduction histidine kinase/CheY-like chemotaxis protein
MNISVGALLCLVAFLVTYILLILQKNDLGIKNQIAGIFLTILDHDMYGEVLQVVLDAMESPYGVFGFIDEEGDLVCPSMTRGIWDQCQIPDKDIVFPRETWGGIWGRALVEKRTFFVNGPLSTPSGHIPISRALTVPIVHEGKVIGYFLVGNKTTDYQRQDIRLLETIADYVAPILDVRLQRDLREKKEKQARAELQEQFLQAQKMEAIGRLAGGIAHDFNNHLTTIGGYAGLLLEVLKGSQKEDAEQILLAVDRSSALTHQLLIFSRKQPVQPKVLDINIIIQSMEKMLSRLIGEDIELELQMQARELVLADQSQLEQVIMNLVVNARDAMPDGGNLLIETVDTDLDRAYHQMKPGSYVMLAVSDNGAGMDEETQSHIFEPFFTTKEAGKGTGLGLATCYGIVKSNNGYIWVYSEVGVGTIFRIYLPQVVDVVPASNDNSINSQDVTGSETILLVEDEDAVRAFTKRILEESGYTVLEAGSSPEAIAMKSPIHMVITDVIMPGGMNGKQLVDRIAEHHADLKVLFMSGYTDNVIARHDIIDDDINFINKPFAARKLLQLVRSILDTDAVYSP